MYFLIELNVIILMIAIGLRRRDECDIEPDQPLIIPELLVDLLIDVICEHGGIDCVSVDGDVVGIDIWFVQLAA